jgi:hypothetical protein
MYFKSSIYCLSMGIIKGRGRYSAMVINCRLVIERIFLKAEDKGRLKR